MLFLLRDGGWNRGGDESASGKLGGKIGVEWGEGHRRCSVPRKAEHGSGIHGTERKGGDRLHSAPNEIDVSNGLLEFLA